MTHHSTRRAFIVQAGAAAASFGLPVLSQAQAFPARTIRYICPWPAGGSTDIVMRALAESAGKTLGQTIIVENKPGAGGMLGANELVNAKPDGYTLAQLPHGVFRIPHMQKVQFDTLKDFTWIACLTGYTFGLVVAGGFADQEHPRSGRIRACQPGKVQLRFDRHRHQPAPRGGGVRAAGGHQAFAHPVQGQCRQHAGRARRPRDGRDRRHGLGPATAIDERVSGGRHPAYSVEKLEFGATTLDNWAYKSSSILQRSAVPTAVEIAPESFCVAPTAIGATRAHCDMQLGHD